MKTILAAVAALALTLIAPSLCRAQSITCIQEHFVEAKVSAGFAPGDVENLIGEILDAQGLPQRGITVIPCDGVAKARAYYYDRDDVPKGDYIFYDPTWVREVIGFNLTGPAKSRGRDEAIVLFGHELGHLLGRHFTANSNLSKIDQELAADFFAGCVAARLDVQWEHVEGLLSRLRPPEDTDYPSRERAIAAAKKNFDKCSRSPARPLDAASSLETRFQSMPPGDGRDLQTNLAAARTLILRQTAPADVARIVTLLVDRTTPEGLRGESDQVRDATWSALVAVPATWWRAPELSEANTRLISNVARFDSFTTDPVPRSPAMLHTLQQLKDRIGYGVPPGRIVSTGPFRMRVDYCAKVFCSVRMILKGYDERGRLRMDASQLFENVKQGNFLDTNLGTSTRLYFEFNQQLVSNQPLSFQLTCDVDGRRYTGGGLTVGWSAANEPFQGYASWLSCKTPDVEASVGISVSPSPDRAVEGPVLVQAEPASPTAAVTNSLDRDRTAAVAAELKRVFANARAPSPMWLNDTSLLLLAAKNGAPSPTYDDIVRSRFRVEQVKPLIPAERRDRDNWGPLFRSDMTDADLTPEVQAIIGRWAKTTAPQLPQAVRISIAGVDDPTAPFENIAKFSSLKSILEPYESALYDGNFERARARETDCFTATHPSYDPADYPRAQQRMQYFGSDQKACQEQGRAQVDVPGLLGGLWPVGRNFVDLTAGGNNVWTLAFKGGLPPTMIGKNGWLKSGVIAGKIAQVVNLPATGKVSVYADPALAKVTRRIIVLDGAQFSPDP